MSKAEEFSMQTSYNTVDVSGHQPTTTKDDIMLPGDANENKITHPGDNAGDKKDRLDDGIPGLAHDDMVAGGSSETKPENSTAHAGDNVCVGQDRLEDNPSGLTKGQLRRIKKKQMWEKQKDKRIEQRREKRQERKRKKQAEAAERGSGEDAQQSSSEFFPQRKRKKKMNDPDASDVKLVIDCGFDDLMQEPDVTKLSKQIQRSYSSNRTSDKPFQFYICNFKDKTKARFDRCIAEYPKWDVNIKEEGLNELFDKDSIVYLTSESPQVLKELDPGKVYVIGGLVDHNHHKGVCYERAVSQGWGHAQLPIAEFMEFKSRKVLTVNHVFEILVAFTETEDWKAAFDRVIPQRKFYTMSRHERRRKAHLKRCGQSFGITVDGERNSGNDGPKDSGNDEGGGEDSVEEMQDGGECEGPINEQRTEDCGEQNTDPLLTHETKDQNGGKNADTWDTSKDESEKIAYPRDEAEQKPSHSTNLTPPDVPTDLLL